MKNEEIKNKLKNKINKYIENGGSVNDTKSQLGELYNQLLKSYQHNIDFQEEVESYRKNKSDYKIKLILECLGYKRTAKRTPINFSQACNELKNHIDPQTKKLKSLKNIPEARPAYLYFMANAKTLNIPSSMYIFLMTEFTPEYLLISMPILDGLYIDLLQNKLQNFTTGEIKKENKLIYDRLRKIKDAFALDEPEITMTQTLQRVISRNALKNEHNNLEKMNFSNGKISKRYSKCKISNPSILKKLQKLRDEIFKNHNYPTDVQSYSENSKKDKEEMIKFILPEIKTSLIRDITNDTYKEKERLF